MLTRSFWLGGAGLAASVIGFAKTIEPLIELGIALIVVAMLARAKPGR